MNPAPPVTTNSATLETLRVDLGRKQGVMGRREGG